jgi:hypothetical protein
MTDIVERLRSKEINAGLCKEAADEIERLRQGVDVVHADLCAESDNMRAEIERLAGCLSEQQRNYEAGGIALAASLGEIERLRAEIKHLKEIEYTRWENEVRKA